MTPTAPSLAAVHPAVALAAAAAFVLIVVALFWPRGGLVGRLQRSRGLAVRVRAEDALKHLYQCELGSRAPTLESLAGALQVTLNRAADVVADLNGRGLLSAAAPEIQLNADGRSYALNVIRAHRLWEQHLAERTGVAESQWHRRAERQEHFITRAQADRLAAGLGHPTYDPHGDPIPTATGEYVRRPAVSLSGVRPNRTVQIMHMEDEPEAVYAQLVASGLAPGMTVRVLDRTPQRMRLWVGGEERMLALMVAANVSVLELPDQETAEVPEAQRLSGLRLGARGRVVRLSPRCRGAERRRLMDLGLLPGTVVTAEMLSPAGNCTAYRVRDALIALRREQGDLIQVVPLEPEVTAA